VGPQGRLSTLGNALAGCQQFNLAPAQAALIIARIVRWTREWQGVFESLAVPGAQIDQMRTVFPRASQIGMSEVERHLR